MDLTFWKSRYDQGLAVLEPFWPYIAAAISLFLAIYVTCLLYTSDAADE